MPLLTLPHIEIAFEEQGDPSGAPVLLLHGFPDSADSWHAVIAEFAGKPVRFIVPSLRGYGATRITEPSAESGQIAALAGDALQLLDGLGIERAMLVGHDWGARAAFAAAALVPERVRGVVGLASEYVAYRNTGEIPPAHARDYWYQWYFHTPQGAEALVRDRAGLCRYLWEVWSPGWQFPKADFERAAHAWANPQFVSTVLSYYRTRHGNEPGSSRNAEAHARLAQKPKITVPAWFVTGLADRVNHPESSEGQEAWFAGPYERVELAGIGHFPHREAPHEVSAVLVRALAVTR